jgi:hypothetical protein
LFLHFGPGVLQILVIEKQGSFLTIAGQELLQLGELSLHAVAIIDRDARISFHVRILGLQRRLGSLISLAVGLFATSHQIQAFQGGISHDGRRGVFGGIVTKQPHTFLTNTSSRIKQLTFRRPYLLPQTPTFLPLFKFPLKAEGVNGISCDEPISKNGLPNNLPKFNQQRPCVKMALGTSAGDADANDDAGANKSKTVSRATSWLVIAS